jgi:hypothetical protein
MTARVRIIEHGIVLLDFTNIREPDKELHHAEPARKLISNQGPGQALVLTDVSGSSFTEAAIDALKKLVTQNRPYVRASALVGLSPLTRIVFRGVIALTRRDIRPFATREQAVAYLLSRRQADVPPLIPVSG